LQVTRALFTTLVVLFAATAETVPPRPATFSIVAVIRLANGDTDGALIALKRAIELNPKLQAQAKADGDLTALGNRPPQ